MEMAGLELNGGQPGQVNTMGAKPSRCIVVGIGNPLLKDDRAGIEVVEALKARNWRVNTAILYSGGLDILDTIMGYDEAVIVDACQIGLPPGTVMELTPETYLNSLGELNCPGMSLGAMLRNGQATFPNRMPGKIRIILVEAEDMSSFSTKCTPVVKHAINDVVARIQMATA
jgi:hydrogenase maturation protease